MAKKSMILKQQATPKFSSRQYNRCKLCGAPHAYLRDYGICRICFRELAYKGQIPGGEKGLLVKKSFVVRNGEFPPFRHKTLHAPVRAQGEPLAKQLAIRYNKLSCPLGHGTKLRPRDREYHPRPPPCERSGGRPGILPCFPGHFPPETGAHPAPRPACPWRAAASKTVKPAPRRF